jgi:transcription elongation factor
MAVGRAELGFKAPSTDFIRWTYEYYMGAPLKQGHKVEVQTTHRGLVRGVIKDTKFEYFTVRVVDTGEILEDVDAKSLRRFYEVGDAVRVIKSMNQDHKGWVLDTKADVVDVVDRHMKEMVHTH